MKYGRTYLATLLHGLIKQKTNMAAYTENKNIDGLQDATIVDADYVVFGDVSDSDGTGARAKRYTWANLKTLITSHVEGLASYFNVSSDTSDAITEGSTNKFASTTNVASAGAIMDSDFITNGLMKRTGSGTYTTATPDTDFQDVLAEGAFADGDKTKLDGIETGADVTDSTNVNAAGAVMIGDTSLTGYGFFLNENNMTSDDATKVSSQSAVKSYVDSSVMPIDKLTTKGDLLTHTGSAYARVGIGANGLVPVADSSQAAGWKWDSKSGLGDVVGSASSVDNNIATFNGITGKAIQDSGFAISDIGDVTAASAFGTDNVLVRSDGTGKGVQATGISIADTTNDITGAGNYGGTGATLSGLTASEITATDASKNLVTLPVATYPSLTELTYVKGATSSIQTQINTKAPTTSPTFATSITGSYLTASEILITDGSKNIVSAPVATYPSLTELTYVKGVTSALQTQLNGKEPTLASASDTVAGKVELATTTETNTGTDTGRAVTPDGLSSAVKTITLTASGGAPLTTAGCSEPTKVEAATNDINYYVLDFDATTEEHAFWSFPVPENWNAGTMNARFYWTNASGLTTETVDWGIAGGSWGDGDAIDAALGTEVTTTDTWISQGGMHESAKSTAITIANAGAGEWVNIVVARKVATDNLTGDARLISVKLTYTIDQYSDEI